MRKALAGVAIGLAAFAIAALVSATPPGRALEAQTFDWRLAASPSPARQDIAIVEINESTVRALAPVVGRWPWPRLIHAGVINYLARCRARVIAYDVQFTEADTQGQYRIGDRTLTGAESDDELIAAVRRAGNVVMLADALFEGLADSSPGLGADAAPNLPGSIYTPGAGLTDRPSIRLPFPALRNQAAAVGHNLLQKDPGGVSRAMFPFLSSRGVAVPSLATAAILLSEHVPPAEVKLDGRGLRVQNTRVPLRDDGQLILRIHGPYASQKAGTAFPVYSFFDVLLSEEKASAGQQPDIPASAFEGKLVFVGTSATGLADVHATAFGGSTPGVYLQATLADNLLARTFIRQTPPMQNLVVIAAAAALATLATLALPVWWALASLGALTVVGAGAATRFVAHGIWVPVFGPAAAIVLSAVGALAWQFFVEGREKRAVRKLFGQYVSPAIFRQLMTNPSVARIGGERRVMSVLFSDIRGFTASSESGNPEAVVSQLNEYLAEMVKVLFEHHGTLDKFVGDQVMGLFGAPVADSQHADHAVRAAIAMSLELDRLNAAWRSAGRPEFDIGIGVNSGEMIAGNVGSESIMSYTVIGDAVNLGARIESLNKEFGTRILISQSTKDLLTQPIATRPLGDAQVKGRREAVSVYEVVVPGSGKELRP